jgi:ABC-type dipeptide/oligopeptide/nickel transport system permease component
VAGRARYAVGRLALAIPTLFGLSFLTFVLGSVAGDPSSRLASAGLPPDIFPTPAQIDAVRHRLGFDRPLLVRYWKWLARALHADLGRSLLTGQSVSDALRKALPQTAALALVAVAMTVLVAVPLGIAGGVIKGRWFQQGLRVLELSGASVPSFFLAYLLIYFFAVKIRLFPVTGQIGWKSIVLPAVTLAVGPAALVARLLQTSLDDVLREDYIRMARGKGLATFSIVLFHAMRNAALPVVTLVGTIIAGLFEGAVVVELVFGRSGIGNLTLQSVGSADYPMVQGVVLLAGVVVVLFNLGVDLLYPFIDPRVRLGGRS